MSYYLEDCITPHPNGKSIHSCDIYGPLFEIPVPGSLKGFEMTTEDQKMAKEVWPAGEDVAAEVGSTIYLLAEYLSLKLDIETFPTHQIAPLSTRHCQPHGIGCRVQR